MRITASSLLGLGLLVYGLAVIAAWLAGVPERIGRQSQWHSFLFLNIPVRQKRSLADRKGVVVELLDQPRNGRGRIALNRQGRERDATEPCQNGKKDSAGPD